MKARLGWLVLFVGLSCAPFRVYFNTFYNAQTLFRQAEARYLREGFSPALRDQYNKVIEKCVVVIRYFPNTPYVDDALYMLGVSYLRLGDYDRSRRRFRELLALFPESPLRGKALLGLAEAALLEGSPEVAREILDTLDLRDAGSRRYARRLRLLVAREERDTLGFLTALVSLGREFPDAVSADLFLEGIDVAIQGGFYDHAETLLGIFRKEFARTSRERLATLRFVDLLASRGDPARALRVLEDMAVDERDTLWPAVAWRKARLLETVGDSAAALILYRALALKRTEEGQRAALLLGERSLMAEAYRDAETWLEKVMDGPQESLKQKARRWLAGLGRLKKAVGDSTLPRDARWVRQAQIWAFDFEKPEKAWMFLDSLRQVDAPEAWPLPVLYLGTLVVPDSLREAWVALLKARDTIGLYSTRLEQP